MTARETTEAQMVGLVRNALLVAGHEMGDEGDHWPVINSTIHSIMKDWEQIQVERNVFTEIKKHFQTMMRELEVLCNESPDEVKPKIRAAIVKLLEIYKASFSPVSFDHMTANENDLPLHLKRADAIIKTLEDNNG
jgi:hypothetical protein